MIALKNQNGNGQFGTKKYLLDDEEDLKQLPLDENIGTVASVIETGNIYLFSPKHSKWVLQKKSSDSSTVGDSVKISNLEAITNTLVGDDIGKSVRAVANEELTKQLIPDNAQEALDTLQEIAEWIQNHPNDVTAMNKSIQDLKAQIGIIPEDSNIIDYIKQSIADLKTDFDEKLAIYSTVIQYLYKTIRISGNNFREEDKTLIIVGRVL